MTTYQYKLTLDDSEMIALTEALNMYLAHCSKQLADGPKAPYLAHQQSIERIQAKLFDNTRQISGSNFASDT